MKLVSLLFCIGGLILNFVVGNWGVSVWLFVVMILILMEAENALSR